MNFLGLDARDAVSESDLEQALMDHLQEFILELGEGFCIEARQKRIIIDDKYYFIELAALIYGEKGLSSLPIQDITGEHIDTDNEYMYYYSVEFIK